MTRYLGHCAKSHWLLLSHRHDHQPAM